MPLVMKRNYGFIGDYTENEKEQLQGLIDIFRLRMADDDPEKNILNNKLSQYSDEKVIRFLYTSLDDLNGGIPKTNYSIFEFIKVSDNDLLVLGAMVFALMSEGILQVRNQLDFNDSGLSIGMFNKTSIYQGWASFIMQTYFQYKAEWKNSLTSRLPNSGFVGIDSEFGVYNGWWY
ncbi:MAG: hypothetical protein ACRCX2_34615 [Paraclostridium sp.]